MYFSCEGNAFEKGTKKNKKSGNDENATRSQYACVYREKARHTLLCLSSSRPLITHAIFKFPLESNKKKILMDTFDVVVVGAGLSGLCAARELKRHAPHLRVVVAEASSRVGGRTLVDEDGTDLGGGYFGPTQDRIMHVIDHLGLKMQKINTKGKTVQLLDGSIKHYSGIIPPVNLLGVIDLGAVMRHMDKEVQRVDLVHPHKTSEAEKWDTMTVEEYLQRHCYTESARKLMRVAIRIVLCVEPCEVSVLAWLWYVKQSGGVKRIFETENGAQDSKVQGGAGQIAPLLAKELEPGTVRLSCPVRRIDYTDRSTIRVDGFGFSLSARFVILALPPMQQMRMEFVPALDHLRCQSLQRYPMGHVVKTFMYYDRPFWREKGLNGSIVCDEGIARVTIEDIKPDGSKPCIMGFVASDKACELGGAPQRNERARMLGEHYAKVFQCEDARHPVAYKEKNWAEEPWVGGCYVGVQGPAVITKYKMAHREPIDRRIFIAGTEAAYRMVGYMDGAVEAGERSARNVLVTMGILPASQYDVVSMPAPSPQMPFVNMDLTFAEKIAPSVPQVVSGIAVAVCAAAYIYFSRTTS
jgi:monoamine oxidase